MSFLLCMGRWWAAKACFTRSDSVAGCLASRLGSGFGCAEALDGAEPAKGMSLILSSCPRNDRPATTASVLCDTCGSDGLHRAFMCARQSTEEACGNKLLSQRHPQDSICPILLCSAMLAGKQECLVHWSCGALSPCNIPNQARRAKRCPADTSPALCSLLPFMLPLVCHICNVRGFTSMPAASMSISMPEGCSISHSSDALPPCLAA